MRIATWNVNSLNARLPRVEEWLDYARPDVLCMQETKLADAAFPTMAFSALGYESASHGDGRWNGVALLSRVGLEDVVRGFAGPADDQGARLVAATCGGVRVHSVYVPNGREVAERALRRQAGVVRRAASATWSGPSSPSDDVAVCGDFNVAPDDRDVWDPAAFVGETHVTAPERERSGAAGMGSRRRVPSGATTRTSSSRGGTTGPGTSTSTWACASTS